MSEQYKHVQLLFSNNANITPQYLLEQNKELELKMIIYGTREHLSLQRGN